MTVWGYHPIEHRAGELAPESGGPAWIEQSVVEKGSREECVCLYCRAPLSRIGSGLKAHEPLTCCRSIVCRQQDRVERARLRAKARAANTIDLAQYEPKRRTA